MRSGCWRKERFFFLNRTEYIYIYVCVCVVRAPGAYTPFRINAVEQDRKNHGTSYIYSPSRRNWLLIVFNSPFSSLMYSLALALSLLLLGYY